MQQELLDHLSELQEVEDSLKSAFVAKDELIKLMVTCAVAQEHVLIVGPPGTAKSDLVKRFALYCSAPGAEQQNGKVPYFEYLLTRFTEPNEIFGPVNIRAFQEGGGHRRVTAGMLPRAEIAFLDEVFKANSAILNALLTILNERVFYNGGKPESVPLLFAIGATNETPDDPTLSALFDRFLVRVWTDNVEEARFEELFHRGWKLELDRIRAGYRFELRNLITAEVLQRLYRTLDEVKLDGVARDYREIVRRIRAEGIELSDRRVIKLLKLVAASALRRKSFEANPGDFWILKHVWNNPDQVPQLRVIVDPYLEGYDETRDREERDLETIAGDVKKMGERQNKLRTDADFADFLQQANRLRQELFKRGDDGKSQPLQEQLKSLIEAAMRMMAEQE